jgi:hypothetical protein
MTGKSKSALMAVAGRSKSAYFRQRPLTQPQQRDVTLRPRGRQIPFEFPSRERKMSEDEKRGSQSRDFAVATGAQVKLYEAVKAHKFDLEITEGVWALDQEIMDRRIEAAQQLLEWLEQELQIESTSAPAPSPNPQTRRWISHSGDLVG